MFSHAILPWVRKLATRGMGHSLILGRGSARLEDKATGRTRAVSARCALGHVDFQIDPSSLTALRGASAVSNHPSHDQYRGSTSQIFGGGAWERG